MEKDYEFEYTRQSNIFILFGLSFLILAGGCCLIPLLFGSYIFAGVVTMITVSVIFLLLNKKRLKNNGKANLSNFEIKLFLKQDYVVRFEDLKYYYNYNGKNGIVFTLGLQDGTKVKIIANNNFCNEEPLQILIDEFNLVVDKYITENKTATIHLTSVMAKKSVIYILIPLTFLTLGGLFFATMPLLILPISVSISLSVAWLQYFIAKKRNKLVDL